MESYGVVEHITEAAAVLHRRNASSIDEYVQQNDRPTCMSVCTVYINIIYMWCGSVCVCYPFVNVCVVWKKYFLKLGNELPTLTCTRSLEPMRLLGCRQKIHRSLAVFSCLLYNLRSEVFHALYINCIDTTLCSLQCVLFP